MMMNISEKKNKKKKHFLHELLSEDQDPFLLKTYISEKQNQIINKKRPTNYSNNSHQTNTTLQLNKQKPIIQQHNKLGSSCSSSPNTIFLHVPARTASILLEAALRIQKQSKTRTHYKKNKRFGLLGSLFKRLIQRNKKKIQKIEDQKEDINYYNNNVRKVKDILRFEFDSCSVFEQRKTEEIEEHDCETCFFEDDGSGGGGGHTHGFFCESSFRFVLQRSSSSSSGRHTPEFFLPAVTPTRRRNEDKESSNNGGDSIINKFQSSKDDEEEDEKEQCSPVSVLDPPFEDDDDVHENDGFDLECSYANVQRTKRQLLYRLCRFEKLAELDPLELEKRMLDQDDNECETSIEDNDREEDDDNNGETSYEENKELKELVYAILFHSRTHNRGQVSEDLKRLVHDLIMEEEIREVKSFEDREMVIERVCEKLELWKEVDSNTIDMMVDEDFSREEIGWKNKIPQVKDLVGELELTIFSFLVEEFFEQLKC